MKTIFIYFLAVLALNESKEINKRKRRGSFRASHPISTASLQIGGIDVDNFAHNGDFYPQDYATESLNLGGTYQILSNSLEKPVQETQEYVPPQSVGAAIIPDLPPPATPVNAAASNVPGDGNSIFLGSGALGVIHLGGGAYVLGSGALGYSEIRRNPRPSIRASTLPPIQAQPNLIPAAVNSPQIPQQNPIFSYTYPGGQKFPLNPNGYEFITPNNVGFGDPLPPRPLKVTNSYAVPTALQLPPQVPAPPPATLFSLPQFPQQQTLSPPQTQSGFLPIYPKRVPNLFQQSYLK